jgi:indolepyruvate ferredoxin oxidoreductase
MGKDDFDPADLEEDIRSQTLMGGSIGYDFSQLSEQFLGSKLYANTIILGVAFQKGWLPLQEKNLLDAIRKSVRKSDVEENLKAFQVGRNVAADPAPYLFSKKDLNFSELVAEKTENLIKAYPIKGSWLARYYRQTMDQTRRWMDLPKETWNLFAVAVYDLVRFGGKRTAENYVLLIWNIYRRDQKKFGLKATQVAIREVYRAMAIKDEVWVATLLTSPEKYKRDKLRYNIDPENGDKISYVHLNRPRFDIFGFKIEFDLNAKDWMLRLMRHGQFLRFLLPQWHQKEKDFRDWYIGLVKNFQFFDRENDYELYVQALKLAENVKGYREIRYKEMDQMKVHVQDYLNKIGAPVSIPITEVPHL